MDTMIMLDIFISLYNEESLIPCNNHQPSKLLQFSHEINIMYFNKQRLRRSLMYQKISSIKEEYPLIWP